MARARRPGLAVVSAVSLTDQLRADHQEFANLGRAIESILRSLTPGQDREQLSRLVTNFQTRLAEHSKLEDEVFYPAVRKVMARSALLDQKYMDHLDNEHRSIDGHLARLVEQVTAPKLMLGWGQTFAIFSAGLRSHMRREEEELFPEAERLLGAEA